MTSTDTLADLMAHHAPSLTTATTTTAPAVTRDQSYSTGADFPRGLIPVHGIRYGERY